MDMDETRKPKSILPWSSIAQLRKKIGEFCQRLGFEPSSSSISKK
jgi:hypothetical protein